LNAQNTYNEVANKQAGRLVTILDLNDSVLLKAYHINILLFQKKNDLRKQNIPLNLLIRGLQKIENTRDSLYHTFLTDDKFTLYLTRKNEVINNN
jgi:hypothetical protein